MHYMPYPVRAGLTGFSLSPQHGTDWECVPISAPQTVLLVVVSQGREFYFQAGSQLTCFARAGIRQFIRRQVAGWLLHMITGFFWMPLVDCSGLLFCNSHSLLLSTSLNGSSSPFSLGAQEVAPSPLRAPRTPEGV
jgi:hypothetical protein